MKTIKIHNLPDEKARELAPLVPMSRGNLRHIVKGRGGVSALMAVGIERAAAKLGLLITRESLNPGCAKCEFARACRKAQREAEKKA